MAGERDRAQAVIDDCRRLTGEIGDPLEGLKDLSALNVKPKTKQAVDGINARVLALIEVMMATIKQLEALLATEYPAIQPDVPTEEVISDIEDQLRTIGAAQNVFFKRPPQATTVGVGTFSPPREHKEIP